MLTTVTIKLRKVAVEQPQPSVLVRNSKRSCASGHEFALNTGSRRLVAGTHVALYAWELACVELCLWPQVLATVQLIAVTPVTPHAWCRDHMSLGTTQDPPGNTTHNRESCSDTNRNPEPSSKHPTDPVARGWSWP